MGPTNIALVKLFLADQALRQAQERLDAASKNVRVQERRAKDLAEKHRLAQAALREQQSKTAQLDLDLRSRDAHIEKLRLQQQTAKNNKEYQAFLIEINTAKVDRSKVEEEVLKGMGIVEKSQAELAALGAAVEAEQAKLQMLKDQSGETVAQLQAEVEAARPARDEAAAALPAKALTAFERLAEHHDGEAMAAIAHPNRRREEYVCTACNMDLVTDVYNKLHSRDELVFCPSCRRILYIPEDLPPENAIKSRTTPRPIAARPARSTRSKGAAEAASDAPPPVIEHRAKGKLGKVLSQAQGETVRSANAAGETPIACEVFVGGQLAGIYKGQTPEQLERAIRYYLTEAKIEGDVVVKALEEQPPQGETAPAAGADIASAEASPASAEEAPVPPEEAPAPADQSPASGDRSPATADGSPASTAGNDTASNPVDPLIASSAPAGDSVDAETTTGQPEPRPS